jgi:hypothetical protein
MLEEHPDNFGIQNNRFSILGRLLGRRLVEGREHEPPCQRLRTLMTIRGLPRQGIRYVIVQRHSEPSGCEMVVWKYLATRSPSSSRSGIRQLARSPGCSILSASAWSGIQMNLIRVIACCSVC